jgi:excisionase family DNA binding protein
MDKTGYYTTKQVAEVLNKSIPTIYKYIQDEKLIPVEDFWRANRGKLFDKEAVDAFKQTLDGNSGMTISEAAVYLETTRSAVQTYLDEGLIPFDKKEWRNKDVTYIQKMDLDEFKETSQRRMQQDRIKQRIFYDRKKNYAFYQRFSSDKISEARLIRMKDQWAFLILPSGEHVSFNEGIYKFELTPDYPLTFGKRTGTPGYAKISALPLHYSLTRHFIDLLYQQGSIANIYMDIQESHISIMLKELSFHDVSEGMAPFLESKLTEGQLITHQKQIKIESSETNLSLAVSNDIKNKIKEMADQQDTSMQEIASRIIEEYFSKRDQERIKKEQTPI